MLQRSILRTTGAYLQSVPTQHKLNNGSVLGSLQGEEVLLGLGSRAWQGNIIVVVSGRLPVFVVQPLLALLAGLLSVHQRLVVGAALVICAVSYNGGQAPD